MCKETLSDPSSSSSPVAVSVRPVLQQYRTELEAELQSILQYWTDHTVDETRGGFIGRITHDETKYPDAPKGSVLNSRILWSFSAAYRLTKNNAYRALAGRAFRYLLDRFVDKDHGGVYWTVTAEGKPLDTKKQIYALSFAVYGLSEYCNAFGDEDARRTAVQLYRDIVTYSYDPVHGGYLEALSREWKEMDDIRLSAKDANERKSTNTHLHVLEGFAALYRVWPDEGLRQKIVELIRIFLDRIIHRQTHHLVLFFEDDWTPKSAVLSYGHDVEAAWLVQDAAEAVGDEGLLAEVKPRLLDLAAAACRGLDADGGLWYEYDAATGELIRQKHSWPQAEAMVGFFNAWQVTGDEAWLQRSLRSWAFVQKHIRHGSGEWKWGVSDDYTCMSGEDKVGIWKCPYHNSRACVEIIRRIGTANQTDEN